MSVRCLKRNTPRACLRLQSALVLYANALAARKVALDGLATSLQRFATAGKAGSAEGQRVQAGVAKVYAGQPDGRRALAQLTTRAGSGVSAPGSTR